MKKFIKTPAANAFLAEQLRSFSIKQMERGHLGRTGQKKG